MQLTTYGFNLSRGPEGRDLLILLLGPEGRDLRGGQAVCRRERSHVRRSQVQRISTSENFYLKDVEKSLKSIYLIQTYKNNSYNMDFRYTNNLNIKSRDEVYISNIFFLYISSGLIFWFKRLEDFSPRLFALKVETGGGRPPILSS